MGLFQHLRRRKKMTNHEDSDKMDKGQIRCGRKRRRKGSRCKTPPAKSKFILQQNERGSVPYSPFRWRGQGVSPAGSVTKRSVRWIDEFNPDCSGLFSFPYVDNIGRITTSTLFSWRCHPMTLIGSVAATVYRRLFRLQIRRHGFRKANSYRELTFKVAAVYSITSDHWVFDRFMGASRRLKNLKHFGGVVGGLVSQLDEDQRFVLRQVLKQTNWLTSRSEKVGDKSRREALSGRFAITSLNYCRCADILCPYGDFPPLVGMFPRGYRKFQRAELVTPTDLRQWLVSKTVRSEPIPKLNEEGKRPRFKRPTNAPLPW